MTTATLGRAARPLPSAAETRTPLAWGRHYAAVRPDHFRVDYVINPHMDLTRQPDRELALAQWTHMVATMEYAGARVDVIEQRADSPDMVYAMNLGLALLDHRRRSGARVVLSHMRHPERRNETEAAQAWFTDSGFTPHRVGESGMGPHLEAGDAFPWRDRLLVGHGPRTDRAALDQLADLLHVGVDGVEIAHPGMYHLDLAFCPLDDRTALVCPDAFEPASATGLLARVPDPIVLTEQEALTFCANSIVVADTVVMPACPRRIRQEIERRGFEVVLVDVSELHKGGGSVRCLTNPLDIALGRDLADLPGGEVRLL